MPETLAKSSSVFSTKGAPPAPAGAVMGMNAHLNPKSPAVVRTSVASRASVEAPPFDPNAAPNPNTPLSNTTGKNVSFMKGEKGQPHPGGGGPDKGYHAFSKDNSAFPQCAGGGKGQKMSVFPPQLASGPPPAVNTHMLKGGATAGKQNFPPLHPQHQQTMGGQPPFPSAGYKGHPPHQNPPLLKGGTPQQLVMKGPPMTQPHGGAHPSAVSAKGGSMPPSPQLSMKGAPVVPHQAPFSTTGMLPPPNRMAPAQLGPGRPPPLQVPPHQMAHNTIKGGNPNLTTLTMPAVNGMDGQQHQHPKGQPPGLLSSAVKGAVPPAQIINVSQPSPMLSQQLSSTAPLNPAQLQQPAQQQVVVTAAIPSRVLSSPRPDDSTIGDSQRASVNQPSNNAGAQPNKFIVPFQQPSKGGNNKSSSTKGGSGTKGGAATTIDAKNSELAKQKRAPMPTTFVGANENVNRDARDDESSRSHSSDGEDRSDSESRDRSSPRNKKDARRTKDVSGSRPEKKSPARVQDQDTSKRGSGGWIGAQPTGWIGANESQKKKSPSQRRGDEDSDDDSEDDSEEGSSSSSSMPSKSISHRKSRGAPSVRKEKALTPRGGKAIGNRDEYTRSGNKSRDNPYSYGGGSVNPHRRPPAREAPSKAGGNNSAHRSTQSMRYYNRNDPDRKNTSRGRSRQGKRRSRSPSPKKDDSKASPSSQNQDGTSQGDDSTRKKAPTRFLNPDAMLAKNADRQTSTTPKSGGKSSHAKGDHSPSEEVDSVQKQKEVEEKQIQHTAAESMNTAHSVQEAKDPADNEKNENVNIDATSWDHPPTVAIPEEETLASTFDLQDAPKDESSVPNVAHAYCASAPQTELEEPSKLKPGEEAVTATDATVAVGQPHAADQAPSLPGVQDNAQSVSQAVDTDTREDVAAVQASAQDGVAATSHGAPIANHEAEPPNKSSDRGLSCHVVENNSGRPDRKDPTLQDENQPNEEKMADEVANDEEDSLSMSSSVSDQEGREEPSKRSRVLPEGKSRKAMEVSSKDEKTPRTQVAHAEREYDEIPRRSRQMQPDASSSPNKNEGSPDRPRQTQTQPDASSSPDSKQRKYDEIRRRNREARHDPSSPPDITPKYAEAPRRERHQPDVTSSPDSTHPSLKKRRFYNDATESDKLPPAESSDRSEKKKRKRESSNEDQDGSSDRSISIGGIKRATDDRTGNRRLREHQVRRIEAEKEGKKRSQAEDRATSSNKPTRVYNAAPVRERDLTSSKQKADSQTRNNHPQPAKSQHVVRNSLTMVPSRDVVLEERPSHEVVLEEAATDDRNARVDVAKENRRNRKDDFSQGKQSAREQRSRRNMAEGEQVALSDDEYETARRANRSRKMADTDRVNDVATESANDSGRGGERRARSDRGTPRQGKMKPTRAVHANQKKKRTASADDTSSSPAEASDSEKKKKKRARGAGSTKDAKSRKRERHNLKSSRATEKRHKKRGKLSPRTISRQESSALSSSGDDDASISIPSVDEEIVNDNDRTPREDKPASSRKEKRGESQDKRSAKVTGKRRRRDDAKTSKRQTKKGKSSVSEDEDEERLSRSDDEDSEGERGRRKRSKAPGKSIDLKQRSRAPSNEDEGRVRSRRSEKRTGSMPSRKNTPSDDEDRNQRDRRERKRLKKEKNTDSDPADAHEVSRDRTHRGRRREGQEPADVSSELGDQERGTSSIRLKPAPRNRQDTTRTTTITEDSGSVNLENNIAYPSSSSGRITLKSKREVMLQKKSKNPVHLVKRKDVHRSSSQNANGILEDDDSPDILPRRANSSMMTDEENQQPVQLSREQKGRAGGVRGPRALRSLMADVVKSNKITDERRGFGSSRLSDNVSVASGERDSGVGARDSRAEDFSHLQGTDADEVSARHRSPRDHKAIKDKKPVLKKKKAAPGGSRFDDVPGQSPRDIDDKAQPRRARNALFG